MEKLVAYDSKYLVVEDDNTMTKGGLHVPGQLIRERSQYRLFYYRTGEADWDLQVQFLKDSKLWLVVARASVIEGDIQYG